MTAADHTPAPAAECVSRDELGRRQTERLVLLLNAVDGRNPFYTRKWSDAGVRVADLVLPRDLQALPLTTKAELVADQDENAPWGTALTEPLERYTRYNQTSSTTGRPLRWLDTNESWQWALECWRAVYRAAHVDRTDRIFFPFSFGPFLGFWTAFEAGTQMGAHCVPAGGMSSEARLALIDIVQPTVVCCTPTYALRLSEVAEAGGGGSTGTLADSAVRTLIVAGEPGGSIPSTRERIEHAWKARVIDHHGLTEVGPVSFECWESPGDIHLNECEFLCEVLDPSTGAPVEDGQQGELVVTTLGRTASPVVRYRTGDLVVRVSDDDGPCACGRTLARLRGGILSRVDDMVCVRGVNVFPAAIEAVVRAVDDVVEYRATVRRADALADLSLEVEIAPSAGRDQANIVALVSSRLRQSIGLTVPVTAVGPGSLPRFEMKARRFVVEKGPDR